MHPKFQHVLVAVHNANLYMAKNGPKDRVFAAMSAAEDSSELYRDKILVSLAWYIPNQEFPYNIDTKITEETPFPERLLHISNGPSVSHPYQLWFQEHADDFYIPRISMEEDKVLEGHLAGMIYTYLVTGQYPGKPPKPS